MPKINFTNALDQAIKRIRSGEEISDVVSDYPEIKNELFSALALVQSLATLPRKSAPLPAKRKLFLQHSVENISLLMRFIQSLKTGSAVALALVILALTGTVSAAIKSLPGDRLFALKKTFESAQLQLSPTPEDRAQLELTLADQRLSDAQTILSQNNSPAVKKQAIDELNQQTTAALNNIKAVASNPQISNNPAIIQQAENISKNQALLAAKLDPNQAQQNSEQNQQAIADIKKIVAAVNDQSETIIPEPSTIDVTGAITTLDTNSITIEKNLFTLSTNVHVADQQGNTLNIKSLSINDTVEVKGNLNGTRNIATIITLVSKASADKTNSSSESKNSLAPTSKIDFKNTSPDNSNPNTDSVIQEKPQDTFGGYIVEPPTQ